MGRAGEGALVFRQDLGKRVLTARTDKGLTQKALADRVGLYHSDISDIEKGQRGLDVAVVAVMSEALEVDPGWLATGRLEPCIAHHIHTHKLVESMATEIRDEQAS